MHPCYITYSKTYMIVHSIPPQSDVDASINHLCCYQNAAESNHETDEHKISGSESYLHIVSLSGTFQNPNAQAHTPDQ